MTKRTKDSTTPSKKVKNDCKTIPVLGKDCVTIGYDFTTEIVSKITSICSPSYFLIASDHNVSKFHLQPLVDAFEFQEPSRRILTYTIPPGESAKTRSMKSQIEDWMLSSNCTRDGCIIALGGGVVGDLFGFVASTFMRGIPIFQIPTTLLAMVDSSVGGKTAVDTPYGKNLIGAFHQPLHVFVDLKYLKTLPRREFINGLAEVIKTAAIWSDHDFSVLENNVEQILAVNSHPATSSHDLLLQVVTACIEVKAHVVTVDEKEKNLRGLLNFGHSVGHAIEAILAPDVLHGECISIGMVKEAEISRNLGHINEVVLSRLVRCLKSYDLPVSLDDKIIKARTSKHCTVESLLEIMKLDKKNVADKKRIVLLGGVGKTVEQMASFVSDHVIFKILAPACKVHPPLKSFIEKQRFALKVPGSKSISNRALILAALGNGVCRLHGLLHSDDVQVMLDALQKLVGIEYNWENNGDTLVISGGSGKLRVPSSEIYLGNAGTAARFLTTVCCLVNSSADKSTVITGPLLDALRSNGCALDCLETEGSLPLSIKPTGLKGGHIKLSASISSQYVSSILLSAPYSENPVTLELVGDAVVSQPYIDMTIAMMKSFGIEVSREPNSNVYHIVNGVYSNPKEYVVEADASSATYPLAFAAITGSTVTVTNIGSNSLQGDAEFAIKVLKEMGCAVTQTPNETTVKGPPRLKPIPSIDMESMTDAFLTASVLAAVAAGGDHKTRIHGISNQRVKECNRIEAMITQLGKFGVLATELPDGIEITGNPENPSKFLTLPEGGVFCYDDHRVAMSFSILATALDPESCPTILEKKCVEKTWPSWWDTLENVLGIKLVGVDAELHESKPNVSEAKFTKKIDSNISTIVIIGMRGAGKSCLGKFAAQCLSLKFIDMDDYFVHEIGSSIANYLSKHSWDEFRKLEVELLNSVLKNHPFGYIVSCGGGIVETSDGQNILTNWKMGNERVVLEISRDINQIIRYLEIDKSRPSYAEDTLKVWNRRKPLYKACSNFEFHGLTDIDALDASKLEFVSFVKFLTCNLDNELLSLPRSYFLSLTFPDINHALDILSKCTEGVCALELRVDLLRNQDEDFIKFQLALIRRHCPLPIIYTIRTVSQGGKFSDNNIEYLLDLLELGLRLGVEFLDLEVTESTLRHRSRLQKLIASKGNSKVIASFHDPTGLIKWDISFHNRSANSSKTMIDIFLQLYEFGDCIKLISKANHVEDNFQLFNFVNHIVPTLNVGNKPLIALNMGGLGQISRCLNNYFTPVTHEKLPVPAAPGQLSVKKIHQIRSDLGLISPKKFFLFGSSISTSMSPALHNAGFITLGLPYDYSLAQVPNWSDMRDIISKARSGNLFGGASVTMPFKQDIILHNLADRISLASKKIGSVNTLYLENEMIVGDNTDWLGIKAAILKRIPNTNGHDLFGCVIGAGGTARAAVYALDNLGFSVRISNRTHSKAVEIVESMGIGEAVLFEDVASFPISEKPVLVVVISTVPGPTQECINISSIMDKLCSYNYPSGSKGIFVEMAYRPRKTILVKRFSEEWVGIQWKIVEGVEIMVEQGLEQFVRFTGCVAPRKPIEEAVYKFYKE